VVLSCNHSKSVSSTNDNQPTYFIIGSGGGFTGLYTQYKINSTGLIETYNFNTNTYQPYNQVNKSKVKQYFNRIEALNLRNMSFNKPGNITDYIIVISDNQKLNRIAWDNGSSEISPEIIAFFKEVFRFVDLPDKT